MRTKAYWRMKSGALVALAALLTGCGLFGGGGQHSPSPTATKAEALDPETWRAAIVEAYRSLEVPEVFLAEGRTSYAPSVVPATDGLPGLVVANTFLPDERPQAGVWTVGADGTTGEPTYLDVGEYALSPVVATDGVSTWIVGRGHDERDGWGLFIARSDDRKSWDIEIDATFGDWTPIAATVMGGDRATVIGTRDGQVSGLYFDGSGVETLELPDAADPSGSSVVGVASDGEQIVVLRTMGGAAVVHVADDRSATWQTITIPDTLLGSGIVRLADSYLVVGKAQSEGTSKSPARAWTSADGRRWAPEKIDVDDAIGGSTSVYPPTAVGERVQAIVGNDDADSWGLFERGEDGAWRMAQKGPDGQYSTTIYGFPVPRADGGTTLALAGRGSLFFDQVTPGAGWIPSDDIRTVHTVRPSGSVRLGAESLLFADGVVRGSTGEYARFGGLYRVEGGAVVDARLAVAQEWADGGSPPLALETSTTAGSTVVVARNAHDGIDAWRYLDGKWEQKAVPDVEKTYLGDLVPVANGWNLLLGSDIYASEDGLSWTKTTELLELDNSTGIRLETMCALPGEDAAVLLGQNAGGGALRPKVWIGSGERWRSVTVPEASFGKLSGCASSSQVVVLAGSISEQAQDDDARALWTSPNGKDWTPVKLGDGFEIGDPVAVDGGFAATGSVDGEPVVWLSDGTTWQWAPAPEGIAVDGVYASGSDVVFVSEFGVPTMTLIPAVADRIAEL